MGCNFKGYNSNNKNILYKSITYAEQTVTIVPVVPILPAQSTTYIFKSPLPVNSIFKVVQGRPRSFKVVQGRSKAFIVFSPFGKAI